MRGICLVFAKPPRPGRAKTRLARGIGEEAAAEVAQAMLADVWRAVGSVGAPQRLLRPVLSTPEPLTDHGLGSVEAWDQGRGDLGERIVRTLRRGLAEAPLALAVGADGVGVPLERYAQAVTALEAGHDAVLGPSEDGGFYLLGLRWCPPALLADLPWSAPDTAVRTRAQLVSHGMSVHDLPLAWDVDDPADLERVRREVPEDRAPATHAVLERLL